MHDELGLTAQEATIRQFCDTNIQLINASNNITYLPLIQI